jgi:hypothetical protein
MNNEAAAHDGDHSHSHAPVQQEEHPTYASYLSTRNCLVPAR